MTRAPGAPDDEDDGLVDDTVVADRAARIPGDATETTAGRRALVRRAADDPAADGMALEIDAETGSTVVVRRESRRRAELAARDADLDLDVTIGTRGIPPLPATVAGDVPAPLGRGARTPTPSRPTYAINRSVPAMVPRARTSPPAPQAPVDTKADEAGRRRRARRRALVFAVAVCVVVLVAISLIAVLAFAR